MPSLPDGGEPDVLPIRPPALSRSQLVALVDCVQAALHTLGPVTRGHWGDPCPCHVCTALAGLAIAQTHLAALLGSRASRAGPAPYAILGGFPAGFLPPRPRPVRKGMRAPGLGAERCRHLGNAQSRRVPS